jgi:hypothetical protein
MSIRSFLKEAFGSKKEVVEEAKSEQVIKETVKDKTRRVKDPLRLDRKDGAEDAFGRFHSWFDWHLQYAQGCHCEQALKGEAVRK